MNPLWSNIFRKKLDEESLGQFLGNVPIFSELNRRDLARLEKIVHLRHYRSGETVFAEGDPGSGMYVIRSGQVRIFHQGRNGRTDEEVALLGPGDFFGETTLTAPAHRMASARTLEPTDLVGLFRGDLLEITDKQTDLAARILLGLTRAVSERLQASAVEIRRLQSGATSEVPFHEPGA